jgi:hypothetical protein
MYSARFAGVLGVAPHISLPTFVLPYVVIWSMRRAAVAFILAARSFAQDDDFPRRLIAFNEPYATFVRKFLGCQPHEVHIENCSPMRGTLDRHLFSKSREAAKKLFDLHD